MKYPIYHDKKGINDNINLPMIDCNLYTKILVPINNRYVTQLTPSPNHRENVSLRAVQEFTF